MEAGLTTFALIHGGAHGAWCWETIVPALQAAGHRVVAPDFPVDRVGATAANWVAAAVEGLAC